MSRELKFRAWFENAQSMQDVTSDISYYLSEPNCPVMQYTGLKDFNETEIYEGDILSYGDPKGYRIIWDDENGCWKPNHHDYPDYLTTKQFCKDTTVIGNIYETPELLK